LRLTWEASVYPLSGGINGVVIREGKGKERETGHAMANGNGMADAEMDLLTLPPSFCLDCMLDRLFSSHPRPSKHPPLTFQPIRRQARHLLGREGLDRVVVGRERSADLEDEDERKGRRKIRESTVLRIFPGMKDWESARVWAGRGEAGRSATRATPCIT